MLHSVKWLDTPKDHSYAAAESYLGLILGEDQAAEGITAIRETPVITKTAGDILRASGHALLPESDQGVDKVLGRVHEGEQLSPVILFRAYPMIIANGFHRVCALYHLDPATEVRCQLL